MKGSPCAYCRDRFEIANIIACQPDEPRFIGDQDVFALQEKVVQEILRVERDTAAKAAAPSVVDPVQQAVSEELKNALRRSSVDREVVKAAIKYLAQPMARFAVTRLRKAYSSFGEGKDDIALLQAVQTLAEDYAKNHDKSDAATCVLQRRDLQLMCIEYVSC